jgi:hypothetical protein
MPTVPAVPSWCRSHRSSGRLALALWTQTPMLQPELGAPPSTTLGCASSCATPFRTGRGDLPRQLANATTLARGDEFQMNFVPCRALFLANFLEFLKAEVQTSENAHSTHSVNRVDREARGDSGSYGGCGRNRPPSTPPGACKCLTCRAATRSLLFFFFQNLLSS